MYDFDIGSDNRIFTLPQLVYCHSTLYNKEGDISFREGKTYILHRGWGAYDFYLTDEEYCEFLMEDIHEVEETFMLCKNL